MASEQHSIPYRKTANGQEMETRPLHVEEWLDGLPYIDFNKTSQILSEATAATNKQSLKPATRMELVKIYNRPYQYYIDSQIKTGTQHTLQSMDNMRQQIQSLKQIAVNLSFACKLTVNETLKRKTLWGQSKPPLEEMLMSMNYLSHALIFSFLEYAPTPKKVWREMHFIYDFAESVNHENNTLNLTGVGNYTIANTYKRIMLASLADPYHLPFGTIWEIFEQLGSWAELSELKPFNPPPQHSGFFISDLEGDNGPVPFIKFDGKEETSRLRLLDTNKLGHFVEGYLEQLNAGQGQDSKLQISPYYVKSILSHMVKSWGLPPKRNKPRKSGQGTLHLTCGVNAAYYFLNNEDEFLAPSAVSSENELPEDIEDEATPTVNYMVDRWNLVNQGPGGFAIIRNDKPQYSVRVGDLIAMGYSNDESKKPTEWTLGIICWLMIKQDKVYKTGIQTITKNAQAGAIRAYSGSELDKCFRRAFIITDPEQPGKNSVLVNKGLYIEGREMEIYFENEKFKVSAHSLLESSTTFEYFLINEG